MPIYHVQHIYFQEVDIVAAPLSVTLGREKAMDFTFPLYYDYTVILMKRPDPSRKKWLTLIQPFHWIVHVLIIVSLPLATAILCILERCNPYYRRFGSRRNVRGLHKYLDALWYMYGALLTQGRCYSADHLHISKRNGQRIIL